MLSLLQEGLISYEGALYPDSNHHYRPAAGILGLPFRIAEHASRFLEQGADLPGGRNPCHVLLDPYLRGQCARLSSAIYISHSKLDP